MGGSFFKPTKTQDEKWNIPEYQAQHLTNLGNIGQDFYNKYGNATQQEQAQMQKGMDFYNQGMGMQAQNQMFGQSSQLANMGMQGMQQFMGGYKPPTASLDMGSLQAATQNPYAQESIDAYSRDVSRGLAEDVMPQLRLGAASRGTQGSSRQSIAEGIAAGKAAQSISSNAANMRNQQYQMGYGTAAQMGMTNAQNQFQADTLRAQMASGALQQGMGGMGQAYGLGQQNIQGGMNMAMMPRQLQQGAGQFYQGMVGPSQANFTQAQYGDSPFSNVMKLASTASSFMSPLGGGGGK